MSSINIVDSNTKKAWNENWQPFEVQELLQIFTYPRVKKQIQLYLKYLPKKGRILEGGCGLGPYLIYLRSMGYDVAGVDYNEEPIKKIKQYDNSLPVGVMDVRNLSFTDESFDGYLSLGVIEHFAEGPQKAIQEAYRVLAEKGVFIVQVPVMNIFLGLSYPFELIKRNKFIRRIFGKEQKIYYWQYYFKRKELKGILEKYGFKILEIVPMDHEHSVISSSKAFRDPESYDGANALGITLSRFYEKYLPWLTAANMVLVCQKDKSGEKT
jgi:SAM-dependent methyltransferase